MNENLPGGSIAAELRTTKPWPPGRETLVGRMEIATGKLALFFTPDARLRATVEDSNGRRGEVISGQFLVDPNTAFRMALSCTPDLEITLAASGQIVGTTGDQALYGSTFQLRPAPPAGALPDLVERNSLARLHRREEVARRVPRPGRKPMPIGYAIEGLKRELAQIEDLLAACRSTQSHHVFGLAARLRLLVARGRNSNPLLQLIAGTYDLPLVVNALDHPIEAPEQGVSATGSFSLREEAETGTMPIDLDVWLDLPGAIAEGKLYSNNQMIRAIADTVGAHFDPDLEPLVELLDSMESGTDIGLFSEFQRWVLNTSYCVKLLGQSVLAGLADV